MYDRNIEGRQLTFRFNPKVLKENLLIDDLETGSVWSQLAQEAVDGPLKGTPLKMLPSVQTTWKQWKTMQPDTLVLSPHLGLLEKPYEYAPTWTGVEGFVRGFRPRELVLGLDLGDVKKAYPLRELKKAGGTIEEEIEGRKISIVYDAASETAVAMGENGELLPAVTVYWKSWLEFNPQPEIYQAKKKSIRGRIEKIDPGDRLLRMGNQQEGWSRSFTVGEEIKLKGNRKLLGKKDATWTDLTPDLLVEVKFVEGVAQALEIKILRRAE